MKLGIFSTQFEMGHVANGISNNAYLTARYMEKKGFDVEVFAPRFKGMEKSEQHGKVKINRFDIRLVSDITYFSFGVMKEATKRNFDLIHSFHYGYFPASVGLRTSSKLGIKHFLTPTFHNVQTSFVKSALFSLYNKTEGKKILSKSFVLPYNEDEADQLKKISKFKYNVVPSPIDNGIFFPRKTQSDKMTILYVGAMTPWKGARIAFDICKEIEKTHKDIIFKFVGSGPLESLKHGAGKNFIFMKDLSLRDLANEFRNADIFLYPTAYESFGRVAAEAMMSGVPVVTTDVGAMPETVGSCGLTVKYGDWASMRENLMRLIETTAARKKLRTSAIKHSRQFQWETVGK